MTTYTYLHIESSGRYFRNSHLLYAGLAWYEQDELTYKEWFPTKEEEEADILEDLFLVLQNFDEIKTYNGSGFCLPYLKNKAKAYKIPSPLEELKHTDLRYLYAPLKKPLGLLSMRQEDLESFLEIARDNPKDSPLLGSSLRNMPFLSAFDKYLAYFQSPKENIEASLADHKLCLSFKNSIPLPKPFSAARDYFYIKADTNRTRILLPLVEGSLKFYFKNYKDYYYLPLEDSAIHKSLGQFVDKSRRKKASPKTCFQKKEGIFYPLFCSDDASPFVCKYDYDDQISYKILSHEDMKNQTYLSAYVSSVLSLLF